jgi:uncharacterized protein (TIGR02246 family)
MKTMKMRLLFALVGWAISFALPINAQQKDTADPKMVQQRDLLGVVSALDEFGALSQKLDEAYNKNDAAAVAALFTEDGLLVAPDGIFSGRQDIEKRYEDTLRRWPITDFNGRRERRHLHAIDNAVWSAGQWASTSQSQTGPVFAWGCWTAIYVREGDAWKFRMLTLSEHPRPAASAETK